jgi:transcriptional regulator with XRE-family HTH domain
MENKNAGTETGWHLTWDLPMPENRALAGVIRRRRERRGWTLSDLARRSGVSRQMLGGVEDDQKNPSLNVTSRIAAAFGLALYQLHLEAWRWLQRQPAGCRKCHYSCVHRGRQKWLNQARQCTRPQKTISAPAATRPVSR